VEDNQSIFSRDKQDKKELTVNGKRDSKCKSRWLGKTPSPDNGYIISVRGRGLGIKGASSTCAPGSSPVISPFGPKNRKISGPKPVAVRLYYDVFK
jgi:hypothetical protein